MHRPVKSPLLARAFARMFAGSLLGLAALAVSAQTAPPASLDATAQAQADQPPALVADQDINRNCLRQTGSRIIPRDKDAKRCVAASGRVYTREDIERTGEIDIVQALRKLDTGIR